MTLFLGCPMWSFKAWAGNFLPAGLKSAEFLREYSARLNTVEGNTTFYALPAPDTVRRWRDESAPGFRFCFKVPQIISHDKKLRDSAAETEAFCERLALLEDKRGPAFLQLPPAFGVRDLPALDIFLARWPRELPLAIEPRHADFFGPHEAEFDAMLVAHGRTRVLFDTVDLFAVAPDFNAEVSEAQHRKPRYPRRLRAVGDYAFVRYIGPPEMDALTVAIEPWIAEVAGLLRRNLDVYFFAHHVDDTHAPQVAAALFGGLQRAGVSGLPQLQFETQPSLF